MAKRRDSASELTPEDFLESRQDDSDSPNPVLDLIRNVDTDRGDDDGVDGEGMSGVRPATINEASTESAWETTTTIDKDGDASDTTATDGSVAMNSILLFRQGKATWRAWPSRPVTCTLGSGAGWRR